MPFHGILTHVEFQQFLYEVCLAQRHLLQTHVLADEMLELVWRDFSQTFESGDFGVGTQFFNGFHTFLLSVAIACLLLVAHAEERSLQDVYMSLLYQVGEELQEEGDNQQADMHAVHIGIGGYDDFVVAQCFYAVFYIQGCLEQVEFFVFINYFLGQSVGI